MTTSCVEQDGRIVLRFANPLRDEPQARGRGSGQQRLTRLAEAIPGGTLDARGLVDGTFVSLPARVRRFGVQVSFPLDVTEARR